jgi:hypothetical protein
MVVDSGLAVDEHDRHGRTPELAGLDGTTRVSGETLRDRRSESAVVGDHDPTLGPTPDRSRSGCRHRLRRGDQVPARHMSVSRHLMFTCSTRSLSLGGD